jgi:NAD(P)-dependent dehydrogenase (short-subunit alcohol dehydrogenase family)
MTNPDNAPHVLIAGAGGGVGLACAEAFASHGAKLILTDYDAVALGAAAGRLGAISRHCDAIGSCSVEILAEKLRSLLPSIDVVTNSAGRGYVRTLAMARVTQAMLPLLRKGSGRRLVFNIPSTGRFPDPDGMFPYASSLDGFQRLSAVLKEQTRGSGIEVVTVVPELDGGPNSNPLRRDRGSPIRVIDKRRTAERILKLALAARPDWSGEARPAASNG